MVFIDISFQSSGHYQIIRLIGGISALVGLDLDPGSFHWPLLSLLHFLPYSPSLWDITVLFSLLVYSVGHAFLFLGVSEFLNYLSWWLIEWMDRMKMMLSWLFSFSLISDFNFPISFSDYWNHHRRLTFQSWMAAAAFHYYFLFHAAAMLPLLLFFFVWKSLKSFLFLFDCFDYYWEAEWIFFLLLIFIDWLHAFSLLSCFLLFHRLFFWSAADWDGSAITMLLLAIAFSLLLLLVFLFAFVCFCLLFLLLFACLPLFAVFSEWCIYESMFFFFIYAAIFFSFSHATQLSWWRKR